MNKILIDGRWRETAESIEVRSPYSGDLIAAVGSANADECDESIDAAHRAAGEMGKLARFQLSRGLEKIASGIEGRKEEFARTITSESAKPIKLARGEVERAIATFAWAAGEAQRFAGDVVPVDTQPQGRGHFAYTIRRPKGVIYGITPFNFPLNLVSHKVAPALAAGNSIIIKPSPRTPLTALLLGAVFLESGLPAGALQIVPMDTQYIGNVLNDDRVAMISFTGSADVGWKLKQQVGKKAVALELGGNAPIIIDSAVDVDSSVSKAVTGAFAYAGQVCISVQRIYVHDSLFEPWTAKFVGEALSLKKGDPANEDVQLSVMIDEAAAKRTETWIKEATDNGAKLLCGGSRQGSLVDATVLTNTDPEMRVVSEEVFAPVAVVERFTSFSEAVDMSNAGKYGLQAGVFTTNLENASYAAENLDYGSVIINDVPTFRVDNMPYGGVKSSGFGREGVRYAMEEMSDLRLIVSSAT